MCSAGILPESALCYLARCRLEPTQPKTASADAAVSADADTEADAGADVRSWPFWHAMWTGAHSKGNSDASGGSSFDHANTVLGVGKDGVPQRREERREDRFWPRWYYGS